MFSISLLCYHPCCDSNRLPAIIVFQYDYAIPATGRWSRKRHLTQALPLRPLSKGTWIWFFHSLCDTVNNKRSKFRSTQTGKPGKASLSRWEKKAGRESNREEQASRGESRVFISFKTPISIHFGGWLHLCPWLPLNAYVCLCVELISWGCNIFIY